VDTAYFPNEEAGEIQILGVTLPEQQIVPGEAFMLDILMRHNLGEGEINVTLTVYDNGEAIGTAPVTLNKAEQKVPVSLTIADRGLHDLSFEIKNGDDTLVQNNTYHTFVNLQAFENILLIERKENESKKLQELLDDKYKVTAISLEQDLAAMPRTLDEMAEFEQTILVGVAVSDMPAGFEELLHKYVYDLGGGLFTAGGANDIVEGSMVAHGYNRNDIANSTYYKYMLPVNVVEYTPPIAVMIVVDTSGSMSMGRLEAAVEGAKSCLDALSDRDFCGVMSFDTVSSEQLQVLPVSQRELILEAIDSIDSGNAEGGTIYRSAIMNAGLALSVIQNVERKHIIIVSDGQPGDEYDDYLPEVKNNMKNGITMSIVSIGGEGDRDNLSKAVAEGGGKFYEVAQNALHTLPQKMMEDLAMSTVGEIEQGEDIFLTIKEKNAITNGVTEADIPPLTGYYGTLKKESAVVSLMGEYVPIFAHWKYGKGTVGSFLSDLNGEWSGAFMDSEAGKTLIFNMVESIFPLEDVQANSLDYVIKTDNYTTQVNVHSLKENCKVVLEVVPVSKVAADAVPNGIAVTTVEENRRYTFEIKNAGLYQITMKELDEAGNVLSQTVTYTTFSYSQEYNAFPDRAPLGEELMTLLSADGKGIVVLDPAEIFASFAETLKREIDPRIVLLIMVIVLVLLDIAVRKFKFKWPWELVREYKQKKADRI
jgi:uncharacterized protein YegL